MKEGDYNRQGIIENLMTAVETKFNQVGTTEDLTEIMNCARDSMVFKTGKFFENTELFTDETCPSLFGEYDSADNTVNITNAQGEKIVDRLLVAIGKVFAAPGCMTASGGDLFSSWGLFLRMLYSNQELMTKTSAQFFKYVLADFFTKGDDALTFEHARVVSIEEGAAALTKVLLDHVRKQICTSVILDGHVYFNDSSLRR